MLIIPMAILYMREEEIMKIISRVIHGVILLI